MKCTLTSAEVSSSSSTGKHALYVLSMKYRWSIVYKHCDHGGLFHLCELELCLNVSVTVCECVRAAIYVTLLAMHLWVFTCTDVFNGCLCACACVRLIALVTQAISHSHCSKLWVGEGHCGADRGDRIERGDGGWVGEKETEGDDNEKLKAARKWDVGLHSGAVLRESVHFPGGLSFFYPFEVRASRFSAEDGGLSA